MGGEARSKPQISPGESKRSPQRLRPVSAADADTPSPALMLQRALSAELEGEREAKWSPAATLTFIGVTCGAFWTLVIVGLTRAAG